MSKFLCPECGSGMTEWDGRHGRDDPDQTQMESCLMCGHRWEPEERR